MINAETFSVVIANYNYASFVVEAVNSALRQTLPPLQVVVVDDGSTDASRELLRRHFAGNPAVELLFQDNGGQLSAHVAGLAACRGSIVCLLDSDDFWDANHLQTLAEAYAAVPTLDCVFTNLRYFGEGEGLYDGRTADYDYGLSALPTVFLGSWFGVPTSGLSMRRRLASRALDVPRQEYREWWADECLVYGGSIWGAHKKYLAAATVAYRRHGQNISTRTRWNPVNRLKDANRRKRLLMHFAGAASVGTESLCMVKHEFQTKPRPSREDLRLYLRLLRRAPLGYFKRLEIAISIYRYYLRTRRRPAT